MPRPHSITEKQRKFAESYLSNGRNATAAYRAVYSAKASEPTATREAFNLVSHPNISPIIAQADRKAAAAVERVADRYAISKGRIAEELAKIAFSNMMDFIAINANGDANIDLSRLSRDEAAALGELTVEEFKNGRGDGAREVRKTKFKLSDKRAALIDLAKLNGYVIERREVRAVKSWAELSDDELAALAQDDGEGPRTTH